MRPPRAALRVLPLLLAAAALAGPLHGQALSPVTDTASRSAEISAFVEGSHLWAGYCPCTATGVVLGADYTRFKPRLLNPSFEVRGSFVPGSPVAENSVALGLRLHADLNRLRPFIDLLAGLGTIHYNPPYVYADGTVYSHDNSAVFQLGGGFQYTVRPNWAVVADVQAQRWNLGSTIPVIFHPVAVNFGVNYRIPFRSYRTR